MELPYENMDNEKPNETQLKDSRSCFRNLKKRFEATTERLVQKCKILHFEPGQNVLVQD